MKLNYRDRIIIGVLLALVIVLAMFFLAIKPTNEDIKKNKEELAQLQSSEAEVKSKIEEIPGLKKDIKASYDEGIKFTETFVDFKEYENPRLFDQFMQKYAEENEVKITSLSVKEIGVSTLGYYYFVPPVVAESLRLQYDINGELQKELNELKKESNALAARTAESIMKADYVITVTAEEQENIWNYMTAIEEQKETIIIDNVALTNIQIKEDKNAEPTEDDEKKLPTATFTISLYSVYEMSEPNTEKK